MSHITGTVQILGAPLVIAPGVTNFNPTPAPGGTKLLMLHFQNPNFKPGDRVEVDLGYDTDVFTAADGIEFWSRPINPYVFPGGVDIRYISGGTPGGSIQMDRFGRGERLHAIEPGHTSFTNCDPFYQPPSYLEPTYDPFWYCTDPPHWENAACAGPATDLRIRVARSVGMIVSVEGSNLSTCSVTLVDTDKVISAGHCHTPAEALTSSVCFDYQTECDGSRPAGYNPRFFKVKASLANKNTGSSFDYSLLQLATAPAGIPTIQMRPDFPTVGEQVFGVHHPNGAVKKLSLPHGEGFATVTGSGSGGITVPSSFHVSGGSSGSGLFDMAGRIVGVLSRGAPCSGSPLTYCPTRNIITDIVPTPPPPVTRDVMVVVDRSGSMSADDGFGRKKIEAARDAVSLFVQLVRAGTGNRAGLVSFSTTAHVDQSLTNVTAGLKNTLIGPAPFSGGLVGGLAASGATTIGGGLDSARGQLSAVGPNPRAILLMTDGLQNTAPTIESVEPALTGITVHAIGFGSESNLDGPRLSALAAAHGGMYMRAGGALALEKFFATAFGNIFESGILFDPEFVLKETEASGPFIPFRVCGEESLTAVIGWDKSDASLEVEFTTPGGAVIKTTTASVDSSSGRTWHFARIALPFAGERNGLWKVRAVRPQIIIPAVATRAFEGPALRYFVNVIPSGGPKMSRVEDNRRYYTGDAINPMVIIRQADGSWPESTKVGMTITAPDTSVGNILGKSGLGPAGVIDGDALSPRQATLQAIEKSTGKPVVNYVDTVVALTDDSSDTGGLFEGGSTFGKAMPDLLRAEGNYTFHAKATYGEGCSGMREILWSIHVETGIDPGKTTVTSTPIDPNGGSCYRMTFTPRDKYGNLLGPGRTDAFTIAAQPGSTPSSGVTDLGNGSYQVDICSDPDSLDPPKFGIEQPGRPAVVVGPSNFTLFTHSVTFLCGEVKGDCCGCTSVQPGRYSTEINIHNATGKTVPVAKLVTPLVLAGAVSGREPQFRTPSARDLIRLPAHAATMDDCCRLLELLLGAAPAGPVPFTSGILEIVSTVPLSVTAVYTASDGSGSAPSISVTQVAPRVLVI
ncbi:MAG: vWA domain-containing protein [Bryobacteraceae bacterium]